MEQKSIDDMNELVASVHELLAFEGIELPSNLDEFAYPNVAGCKSNPGPIKNKCVACKYRKGHMLLASIMYDILTLFQKNNMVLKQPSEVTNIVYNHLSIYEAGIEPSPMSKTTV